MIPDVSIIVPIYNVEKYLKRCVDTLIPQTLQNIEIILVNDGSTDSSGQIAKNYTQLDPRIKLINKPNGGLSSARNAGLAIATGKYIGFIDSDDWSRVDMFEKLFQSAVTHDADMVMSFINRALENGTIIQDPIPLKKDLYVNEEVIDEIFLRMLSANPHETDNDCIQMCVYSNLYRHELIKKNHMIFESERIYISEDILFNMQMLQNAKRVSVVKDYLCYYFTNTLSLTRIYRQDRFEKDCFLFQHLLHLLEQYGLKPKALQRVYRAFIGRGRICIVSEARDNRQSSLFKRLANIRKITNHELMQECLANYPIHLMPLKLRLVTYCMRYHLAILLLVATMKHPRK